MNTRFNEYPGVEFTPAFVSAYENLPRSIQRKVERQLSFLSQDIGHPSLRVRKIMGAKGVWEARVDQRYRLTFELQSYSIRIRALGTHDVYQYP